MAKIFSLDELNPLNTRRSSVVVARKLLEMPRFSFVQSRLYGTYIPDLTYNGAGYCLRTWGRLGSGHTRAARTDKIRHPGRPQAIDKAADLTVSHRPWAARSMDKQTDHYIG